MLCFPLLMPVSVVTISCTKIIQKTRKSKMQRKRDFGRFVKALMGIVALVLFIRVSNGGELSESESLLTFIHAVDPQNVLNINYTTLLLHPCSNQLMGVHCNLHTNTVIGIRFESMNIGGIIDADSLCKLPNLRLLSLAKNQIRGSIPDSISRCTTLRYLNLSGNLLNGSLPLALTRLKNLRRLDVSNNHFTSNIRHVQKYSTNTSGIPTSKEEENKDHALPPKPGPSSDTKSVEHHKDGSTRFVYLPFVIGIALLLLITYFMNMKANKRAKEKKILKLLAHSPMIAPPVKAVEGPKIQETRSELVFFVEEEERFKMEDLLEATADLQKQGFCSSLYKVKLKNGAIYAVKRLKKLQVSFDEFGQTMRKIGELKHPNVLPLLGYNSTSEEKLVFYGYQTNGSLLSLFENYIEGKRDFPWKHRLAIAIGIARGLEAIYQRSDDDTNIIPHGNLKLSNILLNENEEALISEYGYSKFQDPKTACLLNCNGYTAPEKSLSEQGDVFSFGVILLELLTGKIVEKSGIDLPKWVKSIVREEWTGEVFDKEVAKAAMYGFPLLNISLKCVAHFPENRPSIVEVVEKIEEVVNAQEDLSPPSSVNSAESNSRDFSLSVVMESPVSNH